MTKASNLVIVESPSKAKTIGRYLGPDYIVKASMGHLRDLPKSKMGVDFENNFEPHYIPMKGKEAVIAEGDDVVFPRYYVVRTWLSERDCLWNIAGRPYVYANPWDWEKLYEANKDTFPDPDNPDLIVQDMVLEIPPLGDEKREGTFDPAKEYASIQR